MRYRFVGLLSLVGCLLWGQSAQADRVILSPNGDTLPPKEVRAEFAVRPDGNEGSLDWFQVSTQQGIELEAQRFGPLTAKTDQFSFDLQYPLLYELGTFPSLSLGVRDLFNTGNEHCSLYIAASKSLPLSDRQLHFVREFKLSGGLGTGSIGGLFVGAQMRLTAGLSLSAEIYRRRPNIGIALPLVRNLQVRAYSLDGTLLYGLSYTLAH